MEKSRYLWEKKNTEEFDSQSNTLDVQQSGCLSPMKCGRRHTFISIDLRSQKVGIYQESICGHSKNCGKPENNFTEKDLDRNHWLLLRGFTFNAASTMIDSLNNMPNAATTRQWRIHLASSLMLQVLDNDEFT